MFSWELANVVEILSLVVTILSLVVTRKQILSTTRKVIVLKSSNENLDLKLWN